MRPDLNGTCAVVTGLCHKTRRVGIEVEGGARVLVVIEKLTPFADDECDGGVAYDESYFEDLRVRVLGFITSTASGEAGVGIDSIIAAMATVAKTAGIDDIRVIVAKLVYEGDCYTTVDDSHFLAV